jgi:hypothetical protein
MNRLLSFLLLITFQIQAYAAEGNFFSNAVNNIELSFDDTELFANVAEGGPEEFAVPGSMAWIENGVPKSIAVEVRVRGQTSREDCTFPKIEVDYKKAAVVGTMFEGLSKIRLNTHCGEPSEEMTHTEIGRVLGEVGPTREAVAYQLLEVLELNSFRTKLIDVRYNLSSSRVLQRKALALESKKNMLKRLGPGTLFKQLPGDSGEFDIDGENPFAALENWTEELLNRAPRDHLLRVVLFHALIGNGDYSVGIKDLLGLDRHFMITPISPFWNTPLFLNPQLESELLPADFDVALATTQPGVEGFEPDWMKLAGCANYYCIYQFISVQKWRSFFTREAFAEALNFFKSKRSELAKVIKKQTHLTSDEKKIFNQHLDGLIQNIENMYSFKVIASNGIKVYENPDIVSTPACGDEDPESKFGLELPVGTPVFEVEPTAAEKSALSKLKKKAIKVRAIEVRDRSMWTPDTYKNCIENEVWIDADALITAAWPNAELCKSLVPQN